MRLLLFSYSCAFFVGWISALHVFFGSVAHADNQCPNGARIATPADAIVQNGVIDAGTCYDSNNPYIGTQAEDAKLWLRQHAIKSANIECLNSDFAQKLKNLMEAVPGGPPTITDAYRGAAAQAQALASGASKVGPCGSYHQYGLAADFNNASQQTLNWMRSYMDSHPEAGLAHIGAWDPGHVQIAGPHPSRDQCLICGTKGGYGTLSTPPGYSPPTTPDDTQPYTPSIPGRCQPGYSYSNGECTFYDYQCPTGSYMVNGTCTYPSQNQSNGQGSVGNTSGSQTSGSSGSSGTSGSNGTSYTSSNLSSCIAQYFCSNSAYQYRSSTCSMTTIQTCQYGCSGNVCATANSISSSTNNGSVNPFASIFNALNTPNSTSTALGTPSNAFMPTFSQSGISSLTPGVSPTSIASRLGQSAERPGTILSSLSPVASETFTSSDLASDTSSNISPLSSRSNSTFNTIIASIRSLLNTMLRILGSMVQRS